MQSGDQSHSTDGPGAAAHASMGAAMANMQQQQQLHHATVMVQEATGREVTQGEVASLISRIQQLEEANRSKESRIEKLQQHKAQEMAKIVDEVILKWVNDLRFKDEETKAKFITGAQSLAKNANEESGAWEIMCLASSSHMQNVNKIEELQNKINSYESKEKMLRGGGVFGSESARLAQHDDKRRNLGSSSVYEPIPGGFDQEEPPRKRDVWAEIESMLMSNQGDRNFETGNNTVGQNIFKTL